MASVRGQTQARTPSPSSAHPHAGDHNLRVPITRSSTKRACADEFNSSAAILDKGNKRPALADRTNAEQGTGSGRGSKKQTQGSQVRDGDSLATASPCIFAGRLADAFCAGLFCADNCVRGVATVCFFTALRFI